MKNCPFCKLPIKRHLQACSSCVGMINRMSVDELVEFAEARGVSADKIERYKEEEANVQP